MKGRILGVLFLFIVVFSFGIVNAVSLLDEGYTLWNENGLASVQVERGIDDLIGFNLVFKVDDNGVFFDVIHYVYDVPKVNEIKVYYINLSNYGLPVAVKIVPVFGNGEVGQASNDLYFTEDITGDLQNLVNSGVEFVKLKQNIQYEVDLNDFSFEEIQNISCEDIGFECGFAEGNAWGKVNLYCGVCNDESTCIKGKCYELDELGGCLSGSEIFLNCDSQYCKEESSFCSKSGSECLSYNGVGGCVWENWKIYTPLLYWSGESISDSTLFIDKGALLNIESADISLKMIIKNSGLPEGTEVDFEVYRLSEGTYIKNGIRTGNNSIKGTIDSSGKAEAIWDIINEDLVGYAGDDIFSFDVKKGERSLSVTNGDVSPEIEHLKFITKTGECMGDINCDAFALEWMCEDAKYDLGMDGCYWNDNTDSCKGDSRVSCEPIGNRDSCINLGCKWDSYGFWSSFKDWFKNLLERI